MNKLIKQQLNKVEYAQVPPFDDNTTHLVIPKTANSPKLYDVEKCYIIQLDKSLFDNTCDNLHVMWNKGIYPKNEYMKIQVLKVLGNMINVYGFGYNIDLDIDYNNIWTGWLPSNLITLIKQIN